MQAYRHGETYLYKTLFFQTGYVTTFRERLSTLFDAPTHNLNLLLEERERERERERVERERESERERERGWGRERKRERGVSEGERWGE